jgi:thiamine biosynthesis lipoprotein
MILRLLRESFHAMGTDCAAAVAATGKDEHRARRALAAARREVQACERVLSRFRVDSDLSRLNAAAGRWVDVDERLVAALCTALRLRDETEGRFDPTILPALAAAGYDRSFEQLDVRPPAVARDWRARATVEVDTAALRARVEPGAAVDLGGIGKGFGATRALWAMRDAWVELPGGLVDLGGDIGVWGRPPGGSCWRLAVADPRAPASILGVLGLESGGVATSGRDVRRFGPGGRLHHLIDPETGAPAEAGPLAVTVVGPDAAEAEGWSTALAVTPLPAEAPDRPTLSALVIPDDGPPVVLGDLPLVSDHRLVEVFR